MSTTQPVILSRQARKRLQGGDLILRGFDNEEIAEILEVDVSTVIRWRKKVEAGGVKALARKHHSGRPKKLDDAQREELREILLKGAKAAGYQTDRWTSRIVADLIFKTWGVKYSRSLVRKMLRDMGFSYHKPDVQSTKRSQEEIDHWRNKIWPQLKKRWDEQGTTVSIWDESGFSFSPHCSGTWAPIGVTPILYETSGRHNHTGIGFILRRGKMHDLSFHFTIFKGAACFEDFIFFLTELHYFLNGKKIAVLWDNLPAHYAAESHFEDEHPGWFEFAYFPAYSPELDPVEGCWNIVKNGELANFVPSSDEELTSTVTSAASHIDAQQLASCFAHAGLRP